MSSIFDDARTRNDELALRIDHEMRGRVRGAQGRGEDSLQFSGSSLRCPFFFADRATKEITEERHVVLKRFLRCLPWSPWYPFAEKGRQQSGKMISGSTVVRSCDDSIHHPCGA